MSFADQPVWHLVVALGAGLVMGVERERRKGEGRRRHAAGLRTFSLTALLGGVAMQTEVPLVMAVSGLGVVALSVVSAWRAPHGDPGVTTEVALVLAFALGALAQPAPGLSFAVASVASALLAFRTRLHGMARKLLSDHELQDLLVLGVAALVVLPLLPNRPVDPLGTVNPFAIWKLVVLVMAVSALGSLGQRLVRPRLGLTLSGFASGFVSSAATVASMGRLAKRDPRLSPMAVSGATASSVSTLIQLAILVGASSLPLLRALALPLVLGGLGVAAMLGVLAWRATRVEMPPGRPGPTLRMQDAVIFAALLTVVTAVAALAQRHFGNEGVLLAAALSGFADAHAFAASGGALTSAGAVSVATALLGVVAAITANGVTKVVLAALSGPRPFLIQIALGQLLAVGGLWVGWLVSR
jgi:uncharacterized membrane protein (DUF4010 family)